MKLYPHFLGGLMLMMEVVVQKSNFSKSWYWRMGMFCHSHLSFIYFNHPNPKAAICVLDNTYHLICKIHLVYNSLGNKKPPPLVP